MKSATDAGPSTRVVHPEVNMPSKASVSVQRARNVNRPTEEAFNSPARGNVQRHAESPTDQPKLSNSEARHIHW